MDIPEIEWENSGLPRDDHSGIIVPETDCPLTKLHLWDMQLTQELHPSPLAVIFTLPLFSFVNNFFPCERTELRFA